MFAEIRNTHRLRPLGLLALLPALLAALLAGLSAGAAAQTDDDEPERIWQEVESTLPAAPLPQNLLPFYVSPTATMRFAIDSKSIVVGKDGVVRYTLVATAAGGAKNISFEGMRCEVLQKRVYAFGRADGTWARSRVERWEPIQANSRNRQHAELASDFLCTGHVNAGTAAQMAERLRRNGALPAEKEHYTTSGYLAD